MASNDLPFWRTKEFKTSLTVGLVLALFGGGVTVAVNIVSARATASPESGAHGQNNSAVPSMRPTVAITDTPAKTTANTGGWGPDRKTYTMKNPAHYPVINSITDLNDYGDERGFFVCHDLTDPKANGGGWGNAVTAEDQHTYKCQLLYDNDAAPGFDHLPSPSQGVNPMAFLQNTRVRVQLPEHSTMNPAFWAIVTADNANPPEVWAAVTFTSAKPVTLAYVSGSARLLIGGGVTPNGGAPLTDDAALTSNDGALVGDKQDGFVDQNPGYIQFEVTATLG